MDITELIDRAAQAAVEHDDVPASVREAFADMKQRADGLYNVPAAAFNVYFPPEKQREHAAAIAAGRADSGWLSPAEQRESAFRQLNYFIATEIHGIPPIEARGKINAAIESGDFN